MKTSELTGVALDWAVAKCEGAINLRYDTVATWWVDLNGEPRALSSGWSPRQSWHPSTNWAQGGPIIERERLQVTTERNGTWICSIPFAVEIGGYRKYIFTHGPTPLIAAMRCYVASKLGDTVEIPEELNNLSRC